MTPEQHQEPLQILLVEDNPAHADMTADTLETSEIPNRLSVVTDGEMAMEFLCKKGEFATAPRPDLILLDLGLPKKTGLEVLADIKADATLRSIPVVVLTTSKSEEDILKSYDLQASTFITKPVHMKDFTEAIRNIEKYWLATARLPRS